MKASIPSPWFLLGALLGPAAIVTSTRSGGSLLFVLPIAAGAICGLSLLFNCEAKQRFRSRTLVIATAFALLCSVASLGFLFGACANASAPSRVINPPGPNFSYMIAERLAGVPPESEWNRAGVWFRVTESPPTYLPVGYSKRSPRTESEGEWLIDERDGKRLFVPYEGTKIRRSILRAEAVKVTDWEEKRLSRTH